MQMFEFLALFDASINAETLFRALDSFCKAFTRSCRFF